MIRGSMFGSVYDKTPIPFELSWDDLATLLEEESRKPSLANEETKKLTLCICPCRYTESGKRGLKDALSWDWFAADIDNKAGNLGHSTIEAVAEKCLIMNMPFVIYTTTSSSIDAQCFRLMFPLNRTVDHDEYGAVWSSVADWLGCVDEQTKDISRLFVAPRQWEGSDAIFFKHPDGDPLDVDLIQLLHPVAQKRALPRSQTRAWTDTSILKSVCPSQVSLHGEFVSEAALARARTSEKGKRMFGFLVSVAVTAMLKGYAIEPSDLANIGDQLADTMGRHKDDIDHDADNAFDIALGHYATHKAERFENFSKSNNHDKYLARWSKS